MQENNMLYGDYTKTFIQKKTVERNAIKLCKKELIL